MVRTVTKNLYESVMADIWPRQAAICDFGIYSDAHYEAIYYSLRNGDITKEELDLALGDGEKLTLLLREAKSNPHKDIKFNTGWDDMIEEEEEE